MKTCLVVGALTALVRAQSLAWNVIDLAPPVAIVSVPIGGAEEMIVPYNSTAASSAVVADVLAHPLSQPKPARKGAGNSTATKSYKVVVARDGCDTQPLGFGPVPTPDTASTFRSYAFFASMASEAALPSGYTKTFSNMQASSNAYGYMGYTSLEAYDTELCASKCTSIAGCSSFNIYFERDPTVDPAPGCENPASTTVIKCVFWGGPVSTSNANNVGETRNGFEIVVAGSNGYVSQSLDPVAGFEEANYLGEAAINAPLDCAGFTSYMGVTIFTDGPFDAALCAAACEAQSAYNLAHAPADAPAQTCQFFNTFLLLKNGLPEGQYCSLYSMAWDNSYAVNWGETRDQDRYTITYSFTFTNSSSTGSPRIPCNVASASSAIGSASLQPYCSSLLAYTAPATAASTEIVTETVTVTDTIPSATIVATKGPFVTRTLSQAETATVRQTTVATTTTTTTTVRSGNVTRTTAGAPTVTLDTTQTVTQTTTISVASGAPSGTIGYLALTPAVNGEARYCLSDESTHMTDNLYRPGARETFILTADGTLYSVTHNAYYYTYSAPGETFSLLYWSEDPAAASNVFSSVAGPDGNRRLLLESDGLAYDLCVKISSTGDGNSGAGMHVYAYRGAPPLGGNCPSVELVLEST